MEKVRVLGSSVTSTGNAVTQCPAWLRACTPFVVVLSVIGLVVVGLCVFPQVKSMMHYQDCVASGRIDCANSVSTDN